MYNIIIAANIIAVVYLTFGQLLPQTEAQADAQSRLNNICNELGKGLIANFSPTHSDLIFHLRALANCDPDAQLKLDTICRDLINGELGFYMKDMQEGDYLTQRLHGFAYCN